jgi:L-lactate dehydrogenase complex protein LldG
MAGRYRDLSDGAGLLWTARIQLWVSSGTMLVVSGAGRGRVASFLPSMPMALLPVERIKRMLPDAFALLQSDFGAGLFRDRSNVTLITGPSPTADIELSLTLGVHGPRAIHAIVIC